MKQLLSRNVAALATTVLAAVWIGLFITFGLVSGTWVYFVNQLCIGAVMAAIAYTTANRKLLEACLTAAPWLAAMVMTLVVTLTKESVYVDTAEITVRALTFVLTPFATIAAVKLVARAVPTASRQPWTILTVVGVSWLFDLLETVFVYSAASLELWMVTAASGFGSITAPNVLGFAAVYVLCCRLSKTAREE